MKKKKVTLIKANKIYIPREVYTNLSPGVRKFLKNNLSKTTFDPYKCDLYSSGRECKLRESKGQGFCKHCRAAINKIYSYSLGKEHFRFEWGNKTLTKEMIGTITDSIEKKGYKVQIDNRTSYPVLKIPMQFRTNWKALSDPTRRDRQKEVAKAWIDVKGGQCVCPPRFGKTGLASIIAAKSKTRTLILVHQKELADQFKKDFYDYTDLEEKEIKLDKPLLKINPKVNEVENLSVCIFTYQSFLSSKGKERLKILRKAFGLVIVDECHRLGAEMFSHVVSSFWARFRLGLTATPKRRDQRHFIIDNILGPVVVEGGSEQLTCKYSVEKTNWAPPEYKDMRGRQWNAVWNHQSKERKRNLLIARLAKRDIEKGHKVVIPVKRIIQLELISKELLSLKSCSPDRIAILSGRVPKNIRSKMVDDIRAGKKYDVVIAIDKLISVGFNAPPLSAIYLNVGKYFFDMPAAYQEYSRVRTAMKGKKTPIIRIISDEGSISKRSTSKLIEEMEKMKFKRVKSVLGEVHKEEESRKDVVRVRRGSDSKSRREGKKAFH